MYCWQEWDIYLVFFHKVCIRVKTKPDCYGCPTIERGCGGRTGGNRETSTKAASPCVEYRMQNSVLILTIEVDGELGKVKKIKSHLQWVEGAGPEVIQYIVYYIWLIPHFQGDSNRQYLKGLKSYNPELLPSRKWTMHLSLLPALGNATTRLASLTQVNQIKNMDI